MAARDTERRSPISSAAGPSCHPDPVQTKGPASLRLKLFAVLALFVSIGLVGLVEMALREHRTLTFEVLKREGLDFATAFSLSNPVLVSSGDEREFQAVAAELMRRSDLQFIQFDSPRNGQPLTFAREGVRPPEIDEPARNFEVPSSRLVPRDGTLSLEVVLPLRSEAAALRTKIDADGESLVPSSGSVTMSFDATKTQVALVEAASRLRGVQVLIAAFILVGGWIAIRRGMAPMERLVDAARRIGAGEEGVEFLPVTTKEAQQLTLGLRAIQKRLEGSSSDRRRYRMRLLGSHSGAKKSAPDGSGRPSRTTGFDQTESEGPTVTDRSLSRHGSHFVLLVEDNPVNRSVAVDMLETLDCTVVCAEDGVAALAALETESFDLVFMDIQMPRMDGNEATRRIREEEEQSGESPTPIIALTAHSQIEDRVALAEAGMNGHIAKPFAREDLRLAIQEWSRSKKRD